MESPRFEDLFARSPEHTASAPGRVNLIGEHTDHSEGLVMPVAIPRHTTVQLARRSGGRVRAVSHSVGDPRPVQYTIGEERSAGGWVDYLQGVTAVLARAGHQIAGFDAVISSDLPIGAGLSSSASFEVALLRALRSAFSLPIDDLALAQLGQRAETDFVGAPFGVMDQMAASLGRSDSALLIDTRTLEHRRIPLPETADLVIVSSGVTHGHTAGEYRTRRAECEQAALALGVKRLGHLSLDDLPRVERLAEPLRQRARHVVTENARVRQAAAALEAGDLPTLGALLGAAHDSLRDDFQVSIPEIDLLVTLAQRTPGVHGARLAGGGFGRSIVALVDRHAAAAAGAAIARAYCAETGRTAAPLSLRDRG